ncbi:hypothetical protein F4859DRAFT_462877 [Xylaria cf. heliscus]|nr:hypothetical protein F4859DRAFT_462877 [Xylaria cf. heliscus]
MIPTYFSLQDPNPVPPGPLHGLGRYYAHQRPLNTAITPSKRPAGEDDDDIQFISEKPVKRRRISEKQPATSMPQKPMIPLATYTAPATSNIVPIPSITATQIPGSDLGDTERRLSTGMVGLPSDIQAMELTYALRGVSMPVLENFVLDQPFRKPRPSTSPELSPKQLPSTVSPEMLNVRGGQRPPTELDVTKPSSNQIVCQSSKHTPPCQVEKPAMTSELAKATLDTHQTPNLIAPSSSKNLGTPTFPDHSNRMDPKSTLMPPPPPPLPSPYAEVSHGALPGINSRQLENHHHHNSSAHSQKQPCQVCSRLRHQAQLSRAQGLPMVNAALPPHFMPQLHYHTSYGQPIHPQILTMPTGNVHQYSSNFTPVMMPLNGNPFVPLSSHPPPQPPPQQPSVQQQNIAENDKQMTPEQSRKTESPQISQPKNTTDTSATSSPIKPPASLIQPTYRKPSPNLIVDVAETCQEKFPFEEVAKRHNVPVDKVFDVFAAIIQVPLLRCPTDRRRAGRLATARIKEYNKAKRNILDSRADKGGGDGLGAAVDSTDIAQSLGPAELPAGFTLGKKS